MGQALYRKYRSKKLSEIVGQDHITRTLDNALKAGKIGHAYLFTGPRGVGKTSIARILAHEINGLPYTDESTHLDIIEIDAASNRRIDEIRDLRDKVHIAPTSAKYKVYIIDEVHMLTREAFNALLKTLEEPPAHVVFILATTEIHKVPETIISRTQRFTFKAISEKEVAKHLAYIAKSEGISIDEDALLLLAAHGGGSFRDSISLLDQTSGSNDKITVADVQKLTGLAAREHIDRLHTAVIKGIAAEISQAIDKLVGDGINPSQTAKQMAALIRQRIIDGKASHAEIDLLGELLNVPTSNEPGGLLEVILFKAHLAINRSSIDTTVQAHELIPAPESIKSPTKNTHTKDKPAKTPTKPQSPPKQQPISQSDTEPEEPINSFAEPVDWWEEVLSHIKSINNTLYGVLRMAHATADSQTLYLRFGFNFHQKKASDASTQAKIQSAIQAVTGKSYSIRAIHDKNLAKEQQTNVLNGPDNSDTGSTNAIAPITQIFGGVEVLDS